MVMSLVACGGGSDEDDVRSASEGFVSAFKDENWEDVCSLMIEDSRAQLEDAGDLIDAKGGCADVWEKASEFRDHRERQGRRHSARQGGRRVAGGLRAAVTRGPS